MDWLFSNSFVERLSRSLPGMRAILAAPVSVDDVATTAVVLALGLHRKSDSVVDLSSKYENTQTLNVAQMKEIAAKFRK